jgi:hypothetical protein
MALLKQNVEKNRYTIIAVDHQTGKVVGENLEISFLTYTDTEASSSKSRSAVRKHEAHQVAERLFDALNGWFEF